MKKYFEAFCAFGQDPRNIHRMDEYFSPDFEFIPYSNVPPVKGRDDWYRLLLSHPSGYEKLSPEDYIIDDRRKVVVVKIKAEISDSTTREVLVSKRYCARYALYLDETHTIKIRSMEFFWEVLSPGALEITDVFERDWKRQAT
jgi:hypothetical protein